MRNNFLLNRLPLPAGCFGHSTPRTCRGLAISLLFLASVVQIPLHAQDLTRRVIVEGEVPVDRSLTSPSISDARERLQTLPGATSLEDSDDYVRGRGAYLEDFLRYKPGIIIQASQGSDDDKVSIRGSGVQNDDLSGLSIMIDGVRLNQADGEVYLTDIDLQTVKYAEVYRGADALRYGAVSLGGAINLVSMTGREASPLSAKVSFGSFGYYDQQLSSGFAKGNWDVYGAVTNHFQEGYRDHSSGNYQKVTLTLGTKLGDYAENRAYFYYARLEQDHPSGVDKDDLENDPRATDPESIEQNWSTRWNYYRVVDRLVLARDDWSLQLALSWNHRTVTQRDEFEDDFRLGAVRYYSDDFSGDFAYLDHADFLGGKNRFTIGFAPEFEPESDSMYADDSRVLGELLFVDRTYYTNLPFYAENQHYVGQKFSILTGFQAVYVRRVFEDKFKSATLGDQSRTDDYWAVNPKLGFSYEFNDKTMVYLNASRAFQPPSFDESLGIQEGEDGGYVYHPLHSQGAITLELGTRGEYGPLQWDVALYRTWVKDELLDQNNADGAPLGTVNAAHTIHQGIEAGLELEVAHSLLVHNPPLTVSAKKRADGKDSKDIATQTKRDDDRIVFEQAYTLSDFHFDGDDVYGDNRVAGTPVHFYKAELRYEHPCGFYLGTNVEWNIIKYPVDEANTLYADSYALLGVRAGYRTKRGFQVFFEAKNLTDKRYAAFVEPQADARTSDDNDSFKPGNGRAFYGGVSWVW